MSTRSFPSSHLTPEREIERIRHSNYIWKWQAGESLGYVLLKARNVI